MVNLSALLRLPAAMGSPKLKTVPKAIYNHLRGFPVVNGEITQLSAKVRDFVEQSAALCQPDKIHIVDGSADESSTLLKMLHRQGTIQPLPKYENCWLARTNPADVARVESKTFICTEKREEAIPTPKEGVKGSLGNWISPDDYSSAIQARFPGCMKGRTMYVVPFSMGPIASPLAKIGVEITDSAYVVNSMRIMTRMGEEVLEKLSDNSVSVTHLQVPIINLTVISFQTGLCEVPPLGGNPC